MAINNIIYEDFKLLSCQIVIGEANPTNPIIIENQKVINEVVDIVINDNYKTLIDTAEVTLTKGTVFQSDIIKNVTTDGRDSRRVVQQSDKEDRIQTEKRGDGIIIEKIVTQSLVNAESIKVGNRINIKIGYNGKLKNMFDGYIVAISPEVDFVLKCENMAYLLKTKQAPKLHIPKSQAYIHDICGEKFGLLKGTGFELHPDVLKSKINVGAVEMVDNLTVADVFNWWGKSGVHVFLKYDDRDNTGMPKIAVLRPYSSANGDKDNPLENAYPIYFDYHVSDNGLEYMIEDPMFLAVQGTGLMNNGKFFKLTIRKNPSYDPSNPSSKKYQTVNATQISKRQQKKTGNKTASGAETRIKVDLSNYNIIPYVSNRQGITSDELRDECIEWFETYEKNGIEGTVTIFGDYGLTSAVHVNIIDDRNSDKNGIYIVDEVKTTFGVKGYRQELKLPHRVKKTEK